MIRKVKLITASQVKSVNEEVCKDGGNEHLCYDLGKIESALHSAFYPGEPPFQHGGLAKVAGAIAFYISKAHAFFDGNKRTAVLSSALFLKVNDWVLLYPPDSLADLIEACASGRASVEDVKDWFDAHKINVSFSS